MSRISFADQAMAQVVRGNNEGLNCKGVFKIELYDKDGKLKGTQYVKNLVTKQGRDSLLDIMFDAATQITNWYIGLYDGAGTPTVDDTLASKAWNEVTGYTEGTKPEWVADNPSNQSITNGTPATFSINGTYTLKGIFICQINTKGSTDGTKILWSVAAFAGSGIAVQNSDSLKVTYTLSVTTS